MVLIFSGCTGAFLELPPILVGKSTNSKNIYSLSSVYGGLDGTKEKAISGLNNHIETYLCQNGYTILAEQEYDLLTGWGSKNGQTRLIWNFECK